MAEGERGLFERLLDGGRLGCAALVALFGQVWFTVTALFAQGADGSVLTVAIVWAIAGVQAALWLGAAAVVVGVVVAVVRVIASAARRVAERRAAERYAREIGDGAVLRQGAWARDLLEPEGEVDGE